MVEFCNACGMSLPKGDLSFKAGKSYTSHDYTCPSCNKIANPATPEPQAPEAGEAADLVIRNGKVERE